MRPSRHATPLTTAPRRGRPLALAAALLLAACSRDAAPDAAGPPAAVAQADQGWDTEFAVQFHHTAQGSLLMPRAWFLALERAEPARRLALIEHSKDPPRFGGALEP